MPEVNRSFWELGTLSSEVPKAGAGTGGTEGRKLGNRAMPATFIPGEMESLDLN